MESLYIFNELTSVSADDVPCVPMLCSLLLAFKREGCAMLHMWLYVSLLVLVVQNVSASIFIDISKYGIYYNPNTQEALKPEFEISELSRNPFSVIGFRGIKCNCNGLQCGCCTGVKLSIFHFDRSACVNFTYVPEDFAIQLKLVMNEKVLWNPTLSAKNPPPVCLPFVYLPVVTFCVRFYDLYTSGKNLHACIDFETHVVNWPILVLHFDCVKLGTDGISWMKPGNGTIGLLQVAKPEIGELMYDEVNFEPDLLNTALLNTTSQNGDHIGQLKL